jgi:methionyl aminopeptidase
MAGAARPGVTTRELDQIGQRVLRENGAESAPASVYGFPGSNCISVNEEAIHGVPGDRVLSEGDLLKLDVTAVKDGFVADAALTHRVGRVPPQADALARCAESAFRQGARAATAGTRVNEVGRAVEKEVRRRGFRVIRELCGHGVGRAIHEDPLVPNYYEPRLRARLTEGLVITIEPIIAAGLGTGRLQPDGWTVRTADGSLSAHYEHTVVITRGEPILITA